jgi:hypothetical protein
VEREALRAEGLGPTDPAVIAATDFVVCELSLLAYFVRATEYVAGLTAPYVRYASRV